MRSFAQRARPLARDLARGEFERTPDGLYLPRHRALLRGVVTVRSKYGVMRTHNRITAGGAIALSGLFAPGGIPGALGALYVAPFGNPVVTDAAWEAPWVAGAPGLSTPEYVDEYTLWKVLGELGDTEGYAEPTRPQWNYADVGGNLLDNSGAPAAFTIAATTTIDVQGFAITAAPTKLAGRPFHFGDAGGSSGFMQIDLSACDCQQILANTSNYIPTGANATAGTATYPQTVSLGQTYSLSPTGFEVNPYPVVADPPFISGWSGEFYIADPSGDDYFDAGSGLWVDPSGDSLFISNGPAIGSPLISLCQFPGAPLTFNDGDPLNITWGLQL